MDFDEKQQTSAKQYLLGSLGADLQAEMERNLMVGKDALEMLEAAEEDLIEEYISGELTEPEKVQFEQHFLVTPERRASLQFAQLLRDHLARTEPITAAPSLFDRLWAKPGAGYRTAAMLAIIIVLVGGLWLAGSRLNRPTTFASLTLRMSSTTRGSAEAISRTQLTSGIDALRLVLELPPDASPSPNYRVELLSEDGQRKAIPIAHRGSRDLTLEIPATDLPRGRYVLHVYGLNDDPQQRFPGTYSFVIDK